MSQFMIRFVLCNILISGVIGMLLTIKRIFRNSLSSRMQYNLWFLLLGLLAVPLLPFRLMEFSPIFSWLDTLRSVPASPAETGVKETTGSPFTDTSHWMNDFALSVNRQTPSVIGYVLLGIWIAGILAMILLIMKSHFRLHAIEKSALPLQNQEVRRLYDHCLQELKITRDIPVYSTAFLKSPIFIGFFKPRIYLPIHLISDYCESDLRYMLLHELQHYKHNDGFTSYLMNLAGILYWFHPLVWYALKEMRNDREIACDTSVLQILSEDCYQEYGNTLIQFAEKMSRSPFPFTAGLGGNRKQIERRIINIVSYQKPTIRKRCKSMMAFLLTAVLLLGLVPILSVSATETSHYHWNTSSENISYVDLTTYFENQKGSFVFYDLDKDAWKIYNMDRATLQVSPDSTYKIYDALFGLDAGIITPNHSLLEWNGTSYPFDTWNTDQTLPSAMSSSVNWYFQKIDAQLGHAQVQRYIQKIGYGNQNMGRNLSTYWMESSLKISPVEQVELLTKLYDNRWGFAPENITAVKDSICLSSSNAGTFYGKTGTGCIEEQDVNGWFVGYVETTDHTCFFATNITSDSDATGKHAMEITRNILADWKIWTAPSP